MSAALYHVTFRWTAEANLSELERAFDAPIQDWFRLNAHSWVLYAELNASEIAQLIMRTAPGVEFVVLRVDPADRAGWAGQQFWNWLDAKRKDLRERSGSADW